MANTVIWFPPFICVPKLVYSWPCWDELWVSKRNKPTRDQQIVYCVGSIQAPYLLWTPCGWSLLYILEIFCKDEFNLLSVFFCWYQLNAGLTGIYVWTIPWLAWWKLDDWFSFYWIDDDTFDIYTGRKSETSLNDYWWPKSTAIEKLGSRIFFHSRQMDIGICHWKLFFYAD